MPDKKKKQEKKPGQLHNRPVRKELKRKDILGKYANVKKMKYIDPKTGKDLGYQSILSLA